MIFRVEKTKGYTVMSNYHLRDENLSLKAKGLLSLVLSLPESWDYSIKGLCEICKESSNTIMRILQELEAHKYLERERQFGERGRIKGFSYVFYEFPNILPYRQNEDMVNPHLHSPYLQNADMENADMENDDTNKLLNKLITNKQSTNILSTDVVAPDVPREEAPPAKQQQQPEEFIFIGEDKNVRIRKTWYEEFKVTYLYYQLVVNELSKYKKKNNITAHVNDEKYLLEWAQTDKERFEYQLSLQRTGSFDTNDFFQAALRRSYADLEFLGGAE